MHWLTQTFTYDDGWTRRYVHEPYPDRVITAAEAQRFMEHRRRENGDHFTRGRGWLEYRATDVIGPHTLRLEWSDSPPNDLSEGWVPPPGWTPPATRTA